MIGLFGLILWAGYGVGSYGWVLLAGFDVPAASWFSPVHTFDWSSDPGFVPKGKVFPGQKPGSGSGNTTSTAAASAGASAAQAGTAAKAAQLLQQVFNVAAGAA